MGVYEGLGIDPNKSTVREIFGAIVKSDFPGAFVNIRIDSQDPNRVSTLHADGDGSKLIQRLLHARVTGDFSIMGGTADDGLSMNTGDVAAAGFVDELEFCDVININGKNVPKQEVLRWIARRLVELVDLYNRYGFHLTFMGGETADLPDQTASAVFDVTVRATALRQDIIIGNVQPGDLIYGFRSDGQAIWEPKPNSGMMSNGVTMGRMCLMHKRYNRQFPYLVRHNGKPEGVIRQIAQYFGLIKSPVPQYSGRFLVTDAPPCLGGMTVSEAILSPTRQWAILIKLLIDRLKAKGLLGKLHGISMNTGGGASKIGHVGRGIRYVKNMPTPPPIFQLIQEEAGESWPKMFVATNCGFGLDVVCEDDPEVTAEIDAVSAATNVGLYQLGVCEASDTEQNQVVLQTPYGTFNV